MALERNFSYITNPKFGRRTGKDVLGGKTVRKLPDGLELFDDYWTDSENEQVSDSSTNNKENTGFNRNESLVNQGNSSCVGGDTPFTKSYRNSLSVNDSAAESMAKACKGVCFQTRRTLKFSDDQTPAQKVCSIRRQKTPRHTTVSCPAESSSGSTSLHRKSLYVLSENNPTASKDGSRVSRLGKSHLDGSLFSGGEDADDDFSPVSKSRASSGSKGGKKQKPSQKSGFSTGDLSERKDKANNEKKKAGRSMIPKYVAKKTVNKSVRRSPRFTSNVISLEEEPPDKLDDNTFVLSHSNYESDEVFSKHHSERNHSNRKNISCQSNTSKQHSRRKEESSVNFQQSQENSALNASKRNQKSVLNDTNNSVASQFSVDNADWETYSSDRDDNTSKNKSQKGNKDVSKQSKTPVNLNKKQNKSFLDTSEGKELNGSNRNSSSRKRKMNETEKMDNEKSVKKSKERKLLTLPPAQSPTPGVRRSRRTRVPPLEYWRNQRLKYDKELKTIGIEEGFESMTKKNVRKKKSSNTKSSKSANTLQMSKCSELSIHDKSFIDATTSNDLNKQVYSANDFMNGDLAMPELVSFYKSLEWVTPEGNQSSKDDPLQLAKSLILPNVITGFMKISSLQEKPLQYFPKHSAFFNVLYGKVAVTINDTTFILETGDTFHVPVGNPYSIKNIRRDNVKLYFIMLPIPEELEEYEV
ncbi:centromere protein C-like [Centruroides sculpturatus]|uniref:centromere protein C-like n=1 Tax=Centruroides sculpturatus TaxID=218467 RepID=UPI000C6DEC38|nr:centromere protein C-like [Centruroides sculpturatus]